MNHKKLSRRGILKTGTAVGSILCTVVIIIFPACAGPSADQPAPTPGAIDQTALGKTAGALNSSQAWTPRFAEIGGVQMALVPAGCFQMGITRDQMEYLAGFPGSNMSPRSYADQMPAHEVCFAEPFWIDVHEVTQEQFTGFNGGRSP